jgi:hypothetical protein
VADTKLSALATGTVADYYYGIEGNVSKKYHGQGHINVKDYGATGDGTTDDTAAVQSALDAAFGPYDDPNGGLAAGYIQNRPVYFPRGDYKVTSPASATITGAADNGSGLFRLTLSASLDALFVDNEPVCVNGVLGSTAANGFWFITKIDSTHVDLKGSGFTGTYTSGGTMKLPALKTRARGALIYGDGRLVSTISCATTGAACISTNGFDYSVVRGLGFAATTGGAAFDLNWMLPDTPTAQIALQSNSFEDCFFNGSSSQFGLVIGHGGNMGSEILIKNCYISGATVGLGIMNYNALQMSIIGGNIAGCTKGIHVSAGSAPIIHGVGFQNNSGFDIHVERTVGDSASIHGCRTESQHFVKLQSGAAAHVASCTQLNATTGTFCSAEGGSGVYPGSAGLYNNYSLNGVVSSNGVFSMSGNLFANTNPLSGLNTSTAIVHCYDNVGKNPCTVSALPAAGAYVKGLRMQVTDASSAASTSNFSATVGAGKTITGSGTACLPVWCDGSEWRAG